MTETTMASKNRSNVAPANPKLLLVSVKSFHETDEKSPLPSKISLLFTVAFVFVFLLMIELTLRQFLTSIQVSRKCHQSHLIAEGIILFTNLGLCMIPSGVSSFA